MAFIRQLIISDSFRPRSLRSVVVMIRFCCIDATRSHYSVSVQNGGKSIRFCPFTLILLITNTEPNISIFVRSHCSGSVKLIVEY